MAVQLGPLAAAGIGLAVNAAGQMINRNTQQSQNYTNWKRGHEDYKWQRADALADWHMQNEYNSPAAQMKRLQEAGLNPNLVYGNGATQQGAVMRSSNMESAKGQAPQIDSNIGSQALMSYYDMEMRQAQTDNLKLQADVLKQDALLRAAQTSKTLTSTQLSDLDLKIKNQLSETIVQQGQANLQKTQAGTSKTYADIQYTLDQNERAALSNAQSLKIGAQQIVNMRAQKNQTDAQTQNLRQNTQNAVIDNLLKKADLRLRELNIYPGDPGYVRAGAYILESLTNPEGAAHKKITGFLNSLDKHLPDWLKVNAK